MIAVLSFFVLGKMAINTCFDDSTRYFYEPIIILKIIVIVICVWWAKKANLFIHFGFLNGIKWVLPLCLCMSGVVLYWVFWDIKEEIEPTKLYQFIILQFLSGTFEEMMMRGIVFYSLYQYWEHAKNGLKKAMIYASLFFALAHFIGVILHGFDISIFNQIVLAFGIGMFLQAIQVRLKNLTIPITIHALFNVWGSYEAKLVRVRDIDVYTSSDKLFSLIAFSLFVFLILIPLSLLILGKTWSNHQGKVLINETYGE